MRRVAPILLLLVVLATGVGACGEDSSGSQAVTEAPTSIPQEKLDAPDPSPTPAAQQALSAPVKAELAGGGIGLFDIDGITSIQPKTVTFAADAVMTGVSWERWDTDGASGTGTVEYQSCDPNCAEGTTKRVPATITLSDPQECEGNRYFGASAIEVESGPKPDSYLRAPC